MDKATRLLPLLATFWVGIALLLAILLTPRPVVGTVRQNGVDLAPRLPVETWEPSSVLEITVVVDRKPWQISTLRIVPDDCFERLEVNGAILASQYCRPRSSANPPRIIFLRADKPNATVISARIRNTLGLPMGISIFPSQTDWRSVLPRLMIALLIGFLCLVFARRRLFSDAPALWILGCGLLARALYGIFTPYDTRAYDSAAHLEYVKYLASHLRLPPASGWEFHQPPLYYEMTSAFVRAGHLVGWSLPMTIPWIQLLSIAFSCLSLLAAAWVGLQLIRNTRSMEFLVFLALIAGLPALIMLSSRISNDVLITVEIFAAAGLLCRWHREHRVLDWYLLWLLAGIAFLTKLNGLCIPIAVCVLVLFTGRALRPGLRQWAGGIALFLALTVWLPLLRIHERPGDVRNLLLTGKASITSHLKIRHAPEDFLIFNPVAMLRQPFNTPYSNDGRRSNALEYLFRSALFGEFHTFPVPWLPRDVLILALLLLPWMVYGLRDTLHRERKDTPLTILFLTTLVLWLAYLTIFQFSPEQDFRFSPFFAVAGAYFIARGIQHGGKYWQTFGLWCAFAFALLSFAMLTF